MKDWIFSKYNIILAVLSLIFLFFLLFMTSTIRNDLEQKLVENVEKDSKIISREINSYFSKYSEIANQMSTNEIYRDYLILAKDQKLKREYEGFEEVVNNLKRIKETDTVLGLVWLGSVSMNDLVTNDYNYDVESDYDIVNRPWFFEMKNSKNKIVFTSPYVDVVTGNIIISVVSPVYYEGEIIGNLGIDIYLSEIESYVSGYKIGDAGFSALVTDKGYILVHPDKSLILDRPMIEMDKELASVWHKISNRDSGIFEYERQSEKRYLAFDRLPSNKWIVACVVPKSEIQSQLQILWILSIAIMVLLTGVLLILQVAVSKSKEYQSLNSLYASLKETKEEVQKSHLELEAAYQQLRASEDELRLKYIEVEDLSTKDALTEIPNRRSFYEVLEKETSKGASGATILLDVDNFKEINDTMGHVFGDQVLKALAKRLKAIQNDNLYISRFGGDEFFLLLKNTANEKQVAQVANLILQATKDKFIFEKEELYIKVSLGISIFPKDSNKPSELIMNSDMAMYKVKASGKNSFMFFEKSMNEDIIKKTKMIKVIQQALEKSSFNLVYQPQFESSEKELSGFEALLRLSDQDIPPMEFIPIAEETGQIIEIGRWVAEEAIMQTSTWLKKGYKVPHVAINFSVKQLNDLSYIEYLESLILKYKVPAEKIEIEITENVFLEDKEETTDFLSKLKSVGFKISLDDFGTGYSSLRYLSFLPIDKIKLDKSISEKYIEHNKDDVLYNIIALSHSLNLTVIAEGIETEEQFLKMKQGACDCIQGFYFSKPLSADEIEKQYFQNNLR